MGLLSLISEKSFYAPPGLGHTCIDFRSMELVCFLLSALNIHVWSVMPFLHVPH